MADQLTGGSTTWSITVNKDGVQVASDSGIAIEPVVKRDTDGRPVSASWVGSNGSKHDMSFPTGPGSAVIEVIVTPTQGGAAAS